MPETKNLYRKTDTAIIKIVFWSGGGCDMKRIYKKLLAASAPDGPNRKKSQYVNSSVTGGY